MTASRPRCVSWPRFPQALFAANLFTVRPAVPTPGLLAIDARRAAVIPRPRGFSGYLEIGGWPTFEFSLAAKGPVGAYAALRSGWRVRHRVERTPVSQNELTNSSEICRAPQRPWEASGLAGRVIGHRNVPVDSLGLTGGKVLPCIPQGGGELVARALSPPDTAVS
jgi:hypothetical protein